LEGFSESGAEDGPEEKRACDYAGYPRGLTIEADDFAEPEGVGGQQEARG
jgi:hypothetical protein